MSDLLHDPSLPHVQPATLAHYGARIIEHVTHPRRPGRLAAPHGTGTTGSPECGDQVRIDVLVADGTIAEAAFEAYGCPATIAGGSEVISRIVGRPLLAAAGLGEDELARSLGLSAEKRACSNLAADALHGALEQVAGGVAPLRRASDPGDAEGVLVAMSGGVDSSVAALSLVREGRQVVGVTFRFWSDPVCGVGGGCCSPESILTARRVAHRLGIPHLTIDLSHPFYREVVEYFVGEYGEGRTPNPCVRCNGRLRFAELARLADRLGLGWIATGHYASMQGYPPRLRRGDDPSKDQAYVLAAVPPSLLRRARFPLAEMDKETVRRLAAKAGLESHDAEESQDICFIPDGDHGRFLRERLGVRAGAVVDAAGRTLGRHPGTYNFTVGQRKGLGISDTEPLYVTAIDPRGGVVTVGRRGDLAVDTVRVRDVVVHTDRMPSEGRVQLRSSGRAVETAVETRDGGLVLHMRETVEGVAPGQTAVLFDADGTVLAGGTIVSAAKGAKGPVV